MQFFVLVMKLKNLGIIIFCYLGYQRAVSNHFQLEFCILFWGQEEHLRLYQRRPCQLFRPLVGAPLNTKSRVKNFIFLAVFYTEVGKRRRPTLSPWATMSALSRSATGEASFDPWAGVVDSFFGGVDSFFCGSCFVFAGWDPGFQSVPVAALYLAFRSNNKATAASTVALSALSDFNCLTLSPYH